MLLAFESPVIRYIMLLGGKNINFLDRNIKHFWWLYFLKSYTVLLSINVQKFMSFFMLEISAFTEGYSAAQPHRFLIPFLK